MSIMKKNWTYDEVQALIQFVRKHPSLYDRRDADYNQTRTKENIWKTIAASPQIIDKNDEECKKKWKTLRIQQRRIIIKKIKKKEKSSAIQWNCYDALKFLIPHMDWTATDEQSIKTEADLDLTMLSENGGDEELEETEESFDNDERCESHSESSYSETQTMNDNLVHSTVTSRNDQSCVSTASILTTDDPKMNQQYVVTYLPTTVGNQIPMRSEGDALLSAAAANCVTIAGPTHHQTPSHQTTQQQTHQQTLYTEQNTNQTGTVNSVENKYPMNNRIITVPVNTTPTIVNYFLMDVAVQMERLNDIAQMELKIEIHRLLLEKLKNINNLRQPQSICFATPTNPN